MSRQNPKYYEHVFRPVHEVNIAATWAVGALAMPIVNYARDISLTTGYSIALAGGMLAVTGYYAVKGYPLLKRQIRLSINKKEFITSNWLRQQNKVDQRFSNPGWKQDPRQVFLGYGYEWGSEHAQRAYQVLDFDSEMSDVKLPFFLKPIVKLAESETSDLGGKPWIHGLGDERKITTSETTLYGHSIVTGNVGSGKTTLLKLMTANALHMGNILIVIDPKNDTDWRDSIKKEMDYMGIGERFYFIHPAKQSESARMPLLSNYVRLTEIAARVAPLMGATGDGQAFETFAFSAIQSIAEGLRYLGEPIRLTTIQKSISLQRRELAMRVFSRYMETHFGHNWKDTQKSVLRRHGDDIFEQVANAYKTTYIQTHPERAVESIIDFATHDEGHYVKMIASFRPILTTLTASPMDDLFSVVDTPISENPREEKDPRPIVDIEAIMERGGCIYISLDSLTDSKTAGYIARLVLAEIAAVSGHRYNNETKDPRRVTIAVDEVHAAIENNEALLNLLSMGRASSLEMILATQTVSDLEAKTDEATAKRFLGLCNNFITTRTSDPATQEYAASQFSQSSVAQLQTQSQSSMSSGKSMMNIDSSTGARLMKTREDSFPPALLKDLPNLQYVARLADGRTLKMRLPILINDDELGARASWVESPDYTINTQSVMARGGV